MCGGRSRRMGRDKALLPWGGMPLVVHVAQVVAAATGSATLVGPRERYGELGWPLVEDEVSGEGPLGGLIAALAASTAERSLVVACDMPWLSVESLQALIQCDSDADVVVACGERGIEPLCAVYRRRCLPVLRAALREGERAVRRVLERLVVAEWKVPDSRLVTNANTAGEWAVIESGG